MFESYDDIVDRSPRRACWQAAHLRGSASHRAPRSSSSSSVGPGRPVPAKAGTQAAPRTSTEVPRPVPGRRPGASPAAISRLPRSSSTLCF